MSKKFLQSTWFTIFLTALAPAIWGSTYIITSEILPPDRPFIAALIRNLPSGLLLIAYTRYLPSRNDWRRLIILAALNIGFFQAFLFLAAYRLPGGLAAVIGSIQPIVIMLLTRVVDQQTLSRVAIGACIVSLGGMMALMVSPEMVLDPIGIAAATLGAVSMATGTFLARRWSTQIPIIAFTGWQLFLGGLMLAPFALLIDPPMPVLTSSQIMAYVYLCLFTSILAYVLWFNGTSKLPSVAVSSLYLFSPLSAVFLGWLVLGQSLNAIQMVGLVAVLGSVMAVQWAFRKPAEPAKANSSTVMSATKAAA